MSIQIVDNFSLGSDKPIDNRFVVGNGEFFQSRNSIEPKYVGLRIWDKNDNKAYVWRGNSWQEESSGGSEVGPGTATVIPKFTSSKTIGDSIIREEDDAIYVNGRLQSLFFSGPGSGLTQLNASNITSGVLNISRLQANNNHIIVGQGLGQSSNWINLNNLTIGNSMKINLSNTTDSSFHYLTFGKNANNSQELYVNNSLKYKPSNSNLVAEGSLSVGTDSDAPSLGLLVDGSVKFTGLDSLDYGIERFILTTDNSNNLKLDNGTTVPPGGIIIFSDNQIPDGFVLCDGCTYETPLFPNGKSTPNLENKLPIGAGEIELNNTDDINSATSGNSFSCYGVNFIMYVGSPIINSSCN